MKRLNLEFILDTYIVDLSFVFVPIHIIYYLKVVYIRVEESSIKEDFVILICINNNLCGYYELAMYLDVTLN